MTKSPMPGVNPTAQIKGYKPPLCMPGGRGGENQEAHGGWTRQLKENQMKTKAAEAQIYTHHSDTSRNTSKSKHKSKRRGTSLYSKF